MERYKKQLKRRIAAFSAVVLLLAALFLYNQFFASDALKNSVLFAFQCGFSTSFAVIMIFMIVKYRKILNDEDRLRLNYNQENDERAKLIRAKAGAPMVIILSMALVVAGMVAGYFNETIFFVLVSAALFQMLCCVAVKFYLMKTM